MVTNCVMLDRYPLCCRLLRLEIAKGSMEKLDEDRTLARWESPEEQRVDGLSFRCEQWAQVTPVRCQEHTQNAAVGGVAPAPHETLSGHPLEESGQRGGVHANLLLQLRLR